MAVYLVQHGKSLPKDIDPEQRLSDQGAMEVAGVAETAKSYGVRVSRIIHSVKARAEQTAGIFGAALKPEKGIHEKEGLKPLDDVELFAASLDETENLMVVGHLPFMERLNCYLSTGATDKRLFKFQNGGIVCMDKDTDTGLWHIKWSLSPHIE